MNNWQWKRFNFCIFLCFFTPLSHVVITQVPISTWNNLPTIDAIMAVRTVKTLSNCVICIFMNISNWNDCLLLMPTKRRQCRTQKKQYAWNCHVQIAIDILYGDKNMFAPMHKLEEKKRDESNRFSEQYFSVCLNSRTIMISIGNSELKKVANQRTRYMPSVCGQLVYKEQKALCT